MKTDQQLEMPTPRAKGKWDWLNNLLPKGVFPTQIDGLLEQNGHFILLIQKGMFQELSPKQSSICRHLPRNDHFTVIVYHGDPNFGAMRIYVYDAVGPRFVGDSVSDLRQAILNAWNEAGRLR